MSVVQTVFLKRADLPAPRVWQAAITAAGFDVQIDPNFDPLTHSGFLPATYHGKPGGFEYELDRAMDMEGVEGVEGLDAMVAFITHADLRELATSVIAAAALAYLTYFHNPSPLV